MSKAKGNRNKRKCAEFYREKGWIVEDVENNSRFAIRKDLFNLFDLLAIKEGVVMFIQVKSNRPPTQKPYGKWAMINCNEHIRCICWTWYDYQGPRIQEYMGDGKIKEEDLRE